MQKVRSGTYLRCGRNETFYRYFFFETDFVSDYADGYWDKTISWYVDLAGNSECN